MRATFALLLRQGRASVANLRGCGESNMTVALFSNYVVQMLHRVSQCRKNVLAFTSAFHKAVVGRLNAKILRIRYLPRQPDRIAPNHADLAARSLALSRQQRAAADRLRAGHAGHFHPRGSESRYVPRVHHAGY